MTCCFTQTLLMLCVAFAALHTHTHRQKVTHKALLIQPNTASLICFWESKPRTASYSLKRYFTKAFFPWGTQLDCLLCDSHTHTHHLKLISNLIIPLLYWACWSPSGQHHSHFSPVGNTTSSGAHTHTYTPTIFQHLHKYTRCKVAKAKTNTLNLFLKAWPQQTRTHIYKHTVSPQCFTFTFHSITTHAMEKNTHGE